MCSVYIGIDPGISPSLAALDENGKLLWMKDIHAIETGKGKQKKNEINGGAVKETLLGAEHVYIEKAQAMSKFDKNKGKIVGQGVASTGRYMKCAGIIEGICIGLGLPYTLIPPLTWKTKMMPGMQRDKEASLLRVQQLYPGSVKLKKDNHKAEATLICLYGMTYLLPRRWLSG